MAREGWWYRASEAERLAQIDGAIELGISYAVLAFNVGASSLHTVTAFARRHRRSRDRFDAGDRAWLTRARREAEDRRRAYFAGEPV